MDSVSSSTAENTAVVENAALQIARLTERVKILQQQLDWFKRRLFGPKSERRLESSADQLDIGLLFEQPPAELSAPETEQITYTRKKARHSDCVTDSGLRF